ncbi:hypothetical protein GCM10010423_69630 [Streptomyces levis]|uniref:Integral membrane protein n=1 Tax=Streptomyces levis TaxID=285566 RepID=A0ABN3P3V1_9ACTN
MVSSVRDRLRRRAAAAGVLTVIAACAGLLVLTTERRVPESWWPRTGQAFAAHPRPADQKRCEPAVGPGEDLCGRDGEAAGPAEQPGWTGTAWGLVTTGAGLAALVMWRHSTAQARRH